MKSQNKKGKEQQGPTEQSAYPKSPVHLAKFLAGQHPKAESADPKPEKHLQPGFNSAVDTHLHQHCTGTPNQRGQQ